MEKDQQNSQVFLCNDWAVKHETLFIQNMDQISI